VIYAILYSTATGMEFRKEADQKRPGMFWIYATGEIFSGDGAAFGKIATEGSRDLVFFNSPGGSAVEGILIGALIHDRGISTVVPSPNSCYSACALAWLGGRSRLLGDGADVGSHAVFVDENGIKTEKGSGNAVVGAYLSRLGLGIDAIAYLTSASPDNVVHITRLTARKYGIAVSFVDKNGDVEEIGYPAAPSQVTPATPGAKAPPPESAPQPVLHAPPKEIRAHAHPEWRPLKVGSREFTEIQESCSSFSAAQVSECWYQEREAYDWAVAHRARFPKEKYPELSARRIACWDVAKAGYALRFTRFKNCISLQAECIKEVISSHDGWVRGQPELSGTPLWQLTNGSVVTFCGRTGSDNRHPPIVWHWVSFTSVQEPWHHEGWVSSRILQPANGQPQSTQSPPLPQVSQPPR
jgi:hypothetical protein